jgi:hypothetical protein
MKHAVPSVAILAVSAVSDCCAAGRQKLKSERYGSMHAEFVLQLV